MADKSKKGGKPGAPPPGSKKEGEQPPGEGKKGKDEGKGKGKEEEKEKKEEEKKEEPPPKPKSVQPKDEVGTRKGCRRYKWELKDSNKEFWVMGHAEVKLLSVGCLIAALVMFTGTVVHPLLSLMITMEMSIFLFFIIVYTFAINRYMPFILWPITDLLNDLFATAFLAGAVAFAVQSRQTMPMNYFVAVGLSFIIFVCYVASTASAFLTAPLLEFLLALFFLFADAMQLNDKWQGLCWPMMDFLRCVTAALIYFAISITAVAKYSDGAAKAAGVFGFFATIVFAIDFYLIFNDVAKFLKQEGSADETTAHKEEEEDSDSDSD
ncbi:CKLF-like MARVEL transmembrane domain-containing protein 3 [Myotis davidii]|uniref:CKLF-like MARVEL transmembrane domain-containing protein 3 n=1 Tax=Myotis davidii TaxID=225400 RepID=L5LHG2_MYODS|nr:CKLF-like MARVEL transmembrane domain-containing protein 3 [Myotis davidii]